MEAAARRKKILGSSIWTVPGTMAVAVAAWIALPALTTSIETPAARVVLALRWLVVAALPYVAVCVVIMGARFLGEAHNPLAGGETEALKVHCRVMQNTLEQLVWFAIGLLGLATLLEPAHAKVIPIATVLFVVGRLVYWRGYLQPGTLGRAPGVQITACVNVSVLLGALGLFGRTLVAG